MGYWNDDEVKETKDDHIELMKFARIGKGSKDYLSKIIGE